MRKTLIVLGAGTVPLLSFVVERWVTRNEPSAAWTAVEGPGVTDSDRLLVTIALTAKPSRGTPA